MFDIIFDKLLSIEQLSIKSKYKETWGSLSLEGCGCQNTSYFKELSESFNALGLGNVLSFFIDNTQCKSVDGFISELTNNDNWRIHINKSAINPTDKNYHIHFFYSIESLKEWVKDTNPLTSDYFANIGKYKVFVNGLTQSFGGSNFVFCSKETDFDLSDTKYDQEALYNTIHVISNKEIVICPQNHYLTFGNINDISRLFYRNSIIVLIVALSNEYHEQSDKLILKGYRRLQLELDIKQFNDGIYKDYQNNLYHALQWVYETGERADLRLKLLLERITLDINLNESYPQGLRSIIYSALTQAKERYSFITYERKDKYDKELKDLLNDTKKLCDSYSAKIRGVLSNLLRDVLAAFIMIGITQLSKVNELHSLENNNLIKYVFLAFGWYFIVSAIIQLLIDTTDVVHSYNELTYWKKLTKEYMMQSEYDNHIKDTVLKRLKCSIPIYLTLILIYIGIGVCCMNLHKFLHLIIK